MSDSTLLAELTPTVERLLERHLASTREWFPHELVPWSRGRDFEPGEEFDPDEFPLPDAVRSALFVNLLTEDNLPYYFDTIERAFASREVEAWSVWARRWTAEEMRHAIVIRDWLLVTRALDPIALERARMAQVASGLVPHPGSVADALVYVTLQELATQIAHRNTGRLLGDKPGSKVMAQVAGDERLHHLFYRDLSKAAFEIAPSEMMLALERQVRGFAMPGLEGIPDFETHAIRIAAAGIYDFVAHHDHILVPVVLEEWGVASIEGIDGEAEEARARTIKHIDRVGRAARRLERHRSEDAASAESADEGPTAIAV
ncbi:MAG TPA: acyl-ACP desaturase [Acidimicrobiia bacterium]|nr:acyl-ACP desaturase [Acidimicrobiia bacterium]